LKNSRFIAALCGLLTVMSATAALSQAPAANPFLPPQAKAQYERDREYDLQHVLLRLKLDWTKKSFAGTVTHTLVPLRNLIALSFDAADALKVTACKVNGQTAVFEHTGGKLTVHAPASLLRKGAAPITVSIVYNHTPPAKGRASLNGVYGFHWVLTDKFEPRRKPSFWTQGETEGNRDWVPIYDYPNDKTTSETYVEVPAAWYVIGNGKLMGIEENKATKTRTFHWKMTQPHSTYLLSLAGGEMDVVRDTWQGVDLFYCVPKGEGHLIPASFGDTKDMLTFFSNRFGVKYAWPKYAQDAMFDFGGGMENVSATTLGEGSLVDPRNGVRPMASLNSHELAHQWFGDLITTKDWGHVWLNEGFATFCEQIYIEHSRGKDYYDREREGALQSYFNEAGRYKRPIATQYYPNPDAMFDSHTYPKGGLVLHMLRRELGDTDFFNALGYYLRKHGYKNVDTNDLVRAIAESTGRNMQPFFEQWVYKLGHPTIGYSWTYDEATKNVVIDVTQSQDTKDGTPIYSINMPYALLSGGSSGQRVIGTALVDKESQQIRIPAAQKPEAVLLDPGHDILMSRKLKPWQPGEKEAVMKYAPCFIDRRNAANLLLAGEVTDDDIKSVMETVKRDQSPLVVADVIGRAGDLKKEYLRDTFRELAKSRELAVRSAAVTALGKLPKQDADVAFLRGLVNDTEMYDVVRNALNALAEWDVDGNMDLLKRTVTKESRYDTLRTTALNAISRSKSDEALAQVQEYEKPKYARPVRQTSVGILGRAYLDKPAATESLVILLKDEDNQIVRAAVNALNQRNDKTAAPALRTLEKESKEEDIRASAKRTADKLEK
jgi:aminopeptidase N